MWKRAAIPDVRSSERPCPQCAALRAERDELVERVRQLETVLFDDEWVPGAWGINPAGRVVLKVLALRGRATKEALLIALQEGRPGRRDRAEPLSDKMVEVMVCQLRKQLPPEVEIVTIRGEGYMLTGASRLFLTELMKARAA